MAEESNTKILNLMTMFGLNKSNNSESMTGAAIDNFVRQSKDMLYANSWHREQVNALLKQKEAECGHEGTFNPPPDPGTTDEMGNNSFINNTIISDRAAQMIAAAIGDENKNPSQPPTQPPVTPPPANKPAWWKVVLGTLASVLLGALLIFLAWQAFGKQPRYELIAEPFEPPELIEFIP